MSLHGYFADGGGFGGVWIFQALGESN